MGAVQAQGFAHARHAVGLRCTGGAETRISQAIADRTIVRTWALRGTLHLLAAADVRWLLSLVAPFVRPRLALLDRRLRLDEAAITHSQAAIRQILQGGSS